MRFRQAIKNDVFDIIKLYQKSKMPVSQDRLFLDYRKLETAITSENGVWMLTEVDGSICAAISVMIDEDQRIAKIGRLMVDPEIQSSRQVLKESLRHMIYFLDKGKSEIDLVYTTTLSMSLDLQELTIEEGFKILGVFPNVMGEDNTKLNGLSAYFFPTVLERKRHQNSSIHPGVYSFFNISKNQCGLADISSDDNELAQHLKTFEKNTVYSQLPELELVYAKNFVCHRFDELRSKRSQMSNFYPFHRPNCLIMNPKQDIEIFLQIDRDRNFAAIIGEHLNITVKPVELYIQVQQLLRSLGISYIEIINDSADSFGIDCILKAGFTPSAYFPAFKRQGNSRRDYVIFGKSFEYLCRPNLNEHPAYKDFYLEYLKIEGKNYFFPAEE